VGRALRGLKGRCGGSREPKNTASEHDSKVRRKRKKKRGRITRLIPKTEKKKKKNLQKT